MHGGEGTPVKLFYSYSHKDEELRNELADHLFPLQRAGLIEVWHDREMLAGDTVDEEIARKLRSADLVLVLVSPSFIRSEYSTPASRVRNDDSQVMRGIRMSASPGSIISARRF